VISLDKRKTVCEIAKFLAYEYTYHTKIAKEALKALRDISKEAPFLRIIFKDDEVVVEELEE